MITFGNYTYKVYGFFFKWYRLGEKDWAGNQPVKDSLSEELEMKINKLLGFAAVASLALASTVALSTAAQAYPTGQPMTVTANKYTAVAGSDIKVQANRVYPGCKVTFTLKSGSASGTASNLGVTKPVTMYVPDKAGTYELKAVTKTNCKPGVVGETATASIVVTAKPKKEKGR
ncbi:MAG: hypothetical protein RLZ28_1423 [Actinomycetota bacterium]|jgi:hypothetical protein